MMIYIKVKTKEQAALVMACDAVDYVILEPDCVDISGCLNDENVLDETKKKIEALKDKGTQSPTSKSIYLSFPYALREYRAKDIDPLRTSEILKTLPIEGVVVNDIDSFGLLKDTGFSKKVIGGEFLYAYNNKALEFYKKYFKDIHFLSPCELTLPEIEEMNKEGSDVIYKVYGHQILMVTAQNIDKTSGKEGFEFENEKGDDFVSVYDEVNGYSLIYNGAPTFMLDKMDEFKGQDFLFDISIEDLKETEKVLENVELFISGKLDKIKRPKVFTRGHYHKSVS